MSGPYSGRNPYVSSRVTSAGSSDLSYFSLNPQIINDNKVVPENYGAVFIGPLMINGDLTLDGDAAII